MIIYTSALLIKLLQVLKFVRECLDVDVPDHVVIESERYKVMRNLLKSRPGKKHYLLLYGVYIVELELDLGCLLLLHFILNQE